MKKRILLLLFLSSLIANAKTQGLITNKTNLETSKGEKLKYLQENKLEIFSGNKDLYVFTKYKTGELNKEENILKFGLSYDKSFSPKFEMGILGAYKNKAENKELEEEIFNHLMWKNKY